MKNIIILLAILYGLSTSAQSWTPLTFNPDQPNLELNPLKRIAANFGSDNVDLLY